MRVYADNRTGDSAASAVGGIDGVPFLPLFRGQAAVEIIELQLVEKLAITFDGPAGTDASSVGSSTFSSVISLFGS